MQSLITQLQFEHQKIYQELEALLLELSQLKLKRDDDLLIALSTKLLNYVEELLVKHFKEEEMNLFPQLECTSQAKIINKLLQDHEEIKTKNQLLKTNLEEFLSQKENCDWQKSILYAAYNLIATINHHALREDRELFENI